MVYSFQGLETSCNNKMEILKVNCASTGRIVILRETAKHNAHTNRLVDGCDKIIIDVNTLR